MRSNVLLRFAVFLQLFFLIGCKEPSAQNKTSPFQLSEQQLTIWQKGKAEISSYRLEQSRYGEVRQGEATLIFVTEPFSTTQWVKTNARNPESTTVLKLNFVKKFVTGIYPYSMMTSTFFPIAGAQHSLKISSSSQEWCGHTYMVMKRKDALHFTVDSYFEGEDIPELKLPNTWLEDDLWSQIRLNPEGLPQGTFQMIPGFFHLRLLHKPLQALSCTGRILRNGNTGVYQIEYPEHHRQLTIEYNLKYPHEIIGWKETVTLGGEIQTTRGFRLKTIWLDYWNKNRTADEHWQDSLQVR